MSTQLWTVYRRQEGRDTGQESATTDWKGNEQQRTRRGGKGRKQ